MATVYDGTQLVQTAEPPGASQPGNDATAVVWDPQRSLFIAALTAHGYYGSPDGQIWHRLANQPGTDPSGRTARAAPTAQSCAVRSPFSPLPETCTR